MGRDDSQAWRGQASAWIRHSRHFLRSSHYQDCVCVCVLARAYTCACLFRLFSLRYVFSTLHLADLTIYIPSPLSGSSFPRTKTETNSLLHCSTREHWNRDIFPPERPNHPEFSSSSSFLPKSIYIYLFHRRNCGCEKGKTGTGRPVSNRPLSSIVSILPRIRDISSPRC